MKLFNNNQLIANSYQLILIIKCSFSYKAGKVKDNGIFKTSTKGKLLILFKIIHITYVIKL